MLSESNEANACTFNGISAEGLRQRIQIMAEALSSDKKHFFNSRFYVINLNSHIVLQLHLTNRHVNELSVDLKNLDYADYKAYDRIEGPMDESNLVKTKVPLQKKALRIICQKMFTEYLVFKKRVMAEEQEHGWQETVRAASVESFADCAA